MLGKINSAQLCPYCGDTPVLVAKLGYNWHRKYVCPCCNASVGVHKQTGEPLGRVASPAVRAARREAHAWFDPIWQRRILTRPQAYAWLAAAMNLPVSECHIAMFTLKQCEQAIKIIKQHRKFYRL